MPFAALIVAAILIVAAFNNSHGALAAQLEQDVPSYFKWAVALAAVGALGYIPGLRTPSRWLLALVLVVIVVTNYQQLFAGLTNFSQSGVTTGGGGGGQADPASAFITNPSSTPTQTQIAGAGGAGGAASPGSTIAGAVSQGFAGFAGVNVTANPFASIASTVSKSIGFGGFA